MAIKIAGTTVIDDNRNITTNVGTIDGRDISVDGAKLDGISAGATGDQTKADIDALNIDADTLDGQHGSYYTGYTDTAISNLVDSSPATLNTLNELAAALGDDPNFATTVATNIGTKVSKSGDTMTGNFTVPNLGIGTTSITDSAWGTGNTELAIEGGSGYGVIHLRGTGGGSVDTRYSIGVGDSIFYMAYDDVDNVHRAKINASHQLILNEGSGDQRAFHDGYHPNADAWTTARTLTLTGDVTGSVSWDGSGNASITTDWRGGTANTTVNMSNFDITNVNHLTFNDPGPTEGIEWLGGSGWRIVESPDDLTTNSGGNLQFVQGSTREMTLNTSGSLYTAAQGTLWGSSNDGSGSGLDADLLDGVQGSSFLRSDADDTFTGNLTTGADNYITFGPNSSWSSYLRIGGNGRTVSGALSASMVTTNGNLHLDSGSDKGTYLNYYAGTAGILFGSGHSSIVAVMGSDGDLWKGSSDDTGSKYWHAGNDGSGSGLDADLLDGNHASDFYLATNPSGYTTNVGDITGVTAGSGISGGGTSGTVTISHADTSSQASLTALTGAAVVSDIDVDTYGHVTGLATRNLTLANLGYTGATNANYITNNNQLTNGAGYTTNVGDITGVTAGSGITGGGTSGTVTISHADTSSQASVDNSNGTVIQDITLDTYGHITGIASANLDGRYYTETEADGRFVNASGDTITGRLKISSQGSLFFETSANGGYIPRPKGGHLVGNTSSYTGAIKIRMPVHGSTDMISFHVDIYDYATGESITMFIAGYLYQVTGSDEWSNLEVITLTGNTSKDYTVRFGGDGSNNCVWIGETNSTWSYPQVLVRDVQVGYTAVVDSWDDDWFISFVTSFDTVDETVSDNLPLSKSAKSWTTARTLTLSGDASGSVSWDGSANATLSVTVADDSHNHVISNVDGLQTALNGKLSTSGTAADSELLDGKDSSQSQSVNTVAVRNASGELFAYYFNGTGTFSTTGITSGMGRFTGTNGTDTYGRSYTAAAARTLLNVEDGATADQTASEILTAIKTVDGSTSGLDADLLDGNHASAFYLATNPNGYTTNIGTILENGTTFSGTYPAYFRTGANSAYSHPNITFNGSTNTLNVVNIAPSGTVDGRDVLADGTKLDTIATNANNYSFPYTVSASASNSTVVQRHSSGYIYANYFNTSPNDIATGSITKIVAESGDDGFMRHATAPAVRSFLNVADGANNYSLPATPSVTSLSLADYIYHTGDTATYFQFPGTVGEMRVVSNGSPVQKWGRSNNITHTQFGDSVDIRLGDDGDFEMKFNGTDTYFINRAHAGGDVLFMGEGSDGVLETAIRIDFSSAASSVALWYDNNQRLITNATGVAISGDISYTNATINDYIYHNGDTDTYMGFHAVDQWSVVTGGTQRLKVTNDTMTVAATLDMNGHTLDMNNNDIVGVDQIIHEGDTDTYIQFHEADQWRVVTGGTERLEVNNDTMTVAATLSMDGHTLDMNNNNIVGVGQIIHEGDTDTYMEFHSADEWRVVTGGVERLEVNNTQITSAEPIHAPSFHGDGSALTGLSGMNSWTSSTFAWVKDTTYSFTHDLGVAPKAFSVEYVCVSAIYGYAVGDTLFNMGERYSNWGQIVLQPTSTTVKMAMLDAGILIRRQDQQTTASVQYSTNFHVRLNLLG